MIRRQHHVGGFVVLFMAALLVLPGCGGSGTGGIRVFAAASLKKAFMQYGASFGHASFSFAGSDQLAAQIRAGIRPDVFASANTALPAALYAGGLVERPVPFATNKLVLAVPAHGARVASIADLTRPGIRIAVGAPSVPVGAYTLKVLARLGADARRIDANVRSREPSVDGIVGKLTTGAVDAGFLYATDVSAAKGALRAIALPAALQPTVVYAAAVVRGSGDAARAREFVAGLRHGAGAAALAAAGFGAAP